MFRTTQKRIAIGALAALLVTLVVVFGPFGHIGAPHPVPANPGERLAFAARWLLIPGLSLLVGVGILSNARFMSPAAIEGQRVVDSPAFDINQRYNLNTLEQTVLAAVAWTGLALVLPAEQLGLIPRLAVQFGVGRALFWIGYLYAPWARAFGMGLTSYPTAGALIWLAWNALT
ncbi:MAG: MAPEG family protein [Alphaproteobacteria bacterium]